MKSLRQIVELKKIDLVPDPESQAGTVWTLLIQNLKLRKDS